MSKEGNFLIFCIEQYKSAKSLTGKQVMELFNKYRIFIGLYRKPTLYIKIVLFSNYSRYATI